MAAVIVPSGWPSWWNQEWEFELNIDMSNGIVCNPCARQPDASCCGKVASMRR